MSAWEKLPLDKQLNLLTWEERSFEPPQGLQYARLIASKGDAIWKDLAKELADADDSARIEVILDIIKYSRSCASRDVSTEVLSDSLERKLKSSTLTQHETRMVEETLLDIKSENSDSLCVTAAEIQKQADQYFVNECKDVLNASTQDCIRRIH